MSEAPALSPGVKNRLHVRILRLEMVLFLLVLCLGGLVAFQFWLSAQPTPVCYGTAAVAPGLVRPNEVPEVLLSSLGEQVALVLYNVTWRTAERAHARIRDLVHPAYLLDYDTRRRKERELMGDYAVSMNYALSSVEVGRVDQRHAVRVNGFRSIFAGSVLLKREDVSVILHFEKAYPSAVNPYGLVLVRLRLSKEMEIEGRRRRR